MKTKLLAVLLLTGAAAFAAPRVVFGIGFGFHPAYRAYIPPPVMAYAPAPVPVAAAYVPPMPGPGYVWVAGYSYPLGAGLAWRPGYWAHRPFAGAVWVAPRYFGGRYYAGYWRR